MKIVPLIFTPVATLALLFCCRSASAAEPQAALERPLAVLSGAESRVKEAAYHRVTTPADWKKIWLTHLGLAADGIAGEGTYQPVLEVDFNRCLVVAEFEGATINSHGYRVAAMIENNDTIVVRIEGLGYQTFGKDGGAVRVTPYAFIVLPKTEKTIVLEDNVQSIIGEPPVWKEIARLSAVKE